MRGSTRVPAHSGMLFENRLSCPEIGLQIKLGQMGQEKKKAEVVAEYLRGGVTLRELERRHGVSFSTIHRWVKEYERGEGPNQEVEAGQEVWRALVEKDASLSTDLRRLRKELEEERLRNELLNTMIDIAESQMGIAISEKNVGPSGE